MAVDDHVRLSDNDDASTLHQLFDDEVDGLRACCYERRQIASSLPCPLQVVSSGLISRITDVNVSELVKSIIALQKSGALN